MANENMRRIPIFVQINGREKVVGEGILREDGGIKAAFSFDSEGLNKLVSEAIKLELVPIDPKIKPTPSPGYTSHGHHIPGMPTDDIARPLARCGGPGICFICSRDSMTALKRAGKE